MTVNNKQIAGDHYKKYGDLQPWDVVIKWNLGYLEGTALKYIARWRDKGGIDDIKKAIHFLEKLVEISTPAVNAGSPGPRDFAKYQDELSKRVDLRLDKRLYAAAETPKQSRNPDYPGGPESLEEWVKQVEATKALNDYYERKF